MRVKLISKGVAELLKSPEITSAVREATATVLNNAGGYDAGYSANTEVHNRAVGRVYCMTSDANRDNEDNNTLLRALHG